MQATYGLIPYSAGGKFDKLNEAVLKQISRPLTDHDDTTLGKIYLARTEGIPNHVKIGLTTRTAKARLNEMKGCNHPLILIKEWHLPVRGILRLEKLIHSWLNPCRRQMPCSSCKKSHREWFETSEELARETIQTFLSFMILAPYGLSGPERNLQEGFKRHLSILYTTLDVTVPFARRGDYNWQQWIDTFEHSDREIASRYPGSLASCGYALYLERAQKRAQELRLQQQLQQSALASSPDVRRESRARTQTMPPPAVAVSRNNASANALVSEAADALYAKLALLMKGLASLQLDQPGTLKALAYLLIAVILFDWRVYVQIVLVLAFMFWAVNDFFMPERTVSVVAAEADIGPLRRRPTRPLVVARWVV
jgi:hypothetical protein